jgi:hypothetical protein
MVRRLEVQTTFEKLRNKIHSDYNSNSYFGRLDTTTQIWIRNLCELIDEISKNAVLTSAMHSDGESDAVYCAGCGFTHRPGKCPDGLNGRR